jgi:hypothetical protein
VTPDQPFGLLRTSSSGEWPPPNGLGLLRLKKRKSQAASSHSALEGREQGINVSSEPFNPARNNTSTAQSKNQTQHTTHHSSIQHAFHHGNDPGFRRLHHGPRATPGVCSGEATSPLRELPEGRIRLVRIQLLPKCRRERQRCRLQSW